MMAEPIVGGSKRRGGNARSRCDGVSSVIGSAYTELA